MNWFALKSNQWLGIDKLGITIGYGGRETLDDFSKAICTYELKDYPDGLEVSLKKNSRSIDIQGNNYRFASLEERVAFGDEFKMLFPTATNLSRTNSFLKVCADSFKAFGVFSLILMITVFIEVSSSSRATSTGNRIGKGEAVVTFFTNMPLTYAFSGYAGLMAIISGNAWLKWRNYKRTTVWLITRS